jgi:hypothetical protein
VLVGVVAAWRVAEAHSVNGVIKEQAEFREMRFPAEPVCVANGSDVDKGDSAVADRVDCRLWDGIVSPSAPG